MAYHGKFKIGNTQYPFASTLFGTCSSAASSQEKAVTCADFNQLLTGVVITVKFSNTNSAENPTLNVNSTGAKPIFRYTNTRPSTTQTTSWTDGGIVRFLYDGTHWLIVR